MTDDVVPSSPAIFIILPFDCLSLIFIIARHVNVLQLFSSVTLTNVLSYNRQDNPVKRGLISNRNTLDVNLK